MSPTRFLHPALKLLIFTEVEVNSGGHLPNHKMAREISSTFTDTEVDNNYYCLSIYQFKLKKIAPKITLSLIINSKMIDF